MNSFATKVRLCIQNSPMKKSLFFGIFSLLSIGLLWKDALHFSIPVAFFICIILAWKMCADSLGQELTLYSQGIQEEMNKAQDVLNAAKNRLALAEKTQREFTKTKDVLLQSAYQEAAHILQKTDEEMDIMGDNQMRQIALDRMVLRQKCKINMGKELISLMRDYIADQTQSNAYVLNQHESVSQVVSRKITESFAHTSSVSK